jgi:hypothetical protein
MDYQNKKYISEALRIANDLMCLAGDGDTLGDGGGSGILFGVLRDCAYKIRRHAEHEGHKAQRDFLRSKTMLVIFAAAAMSMVFASPAKATIILSIDRNKTLGGLSFGKNELAEYDPSTDTATLYFNELGAVSDLDAAHVLDTGNIILSTTEAATLGGLSFDAGDLVEYNPTTGTATLYFDQDLFSQAENIDAAYILDNGNIILSTVVNASLGGLSFNSGDLAEYNPTTDTATLYFDGSLFSSTENIDAAHILSNGNIVLSTVGDATLGGMTFGAADLAEYNPTTDVATLYFDGSLFSGPGTAPNLDAVYVTTVPEPATIALLGLGSLVLIGQKRE